MSNFFEATILSLTLSLVTTHKLSKIFNISLPIDVEVLSNWVTNTKYFILFYLFIYLFIFLKKHVIIVYKNY